MMNFDKAMTEMYETLMDVRSTRIALKNTMAQIRIDAIMEVRKNNDEWEQCASIIERDIQKDSVKYPKVLAK